MCKVVSNSRVTFFNGQVNGYQAGEYVQIQYCSNCDFGADPYYYINRSLCPTCGSSTLSRIAKWVPKEDTSLWRKLRVGDLTSEDGNWVLK
jgi:predicted RNA-binding Zn-ribbon protein involved in translation (DUF1610 family)